MAVGEFVLCKLGQRHIYTYLGERFMFIYRSSNVLHEYTTTIKKASKSSGTKLTKLESLQVAVTHTQMHNLYDSYSAHEIRRVVVSTFTSEFVFILWGGKVSYDVN